MNACYRPEADVQGRPVLSKAAPKQKLIMVESQLGHLSNEGN